MMQSCRLFNWRPFQRSCLTAFARPVSSTQSTSSAEEPILLCHDAPNGVRTLTLNQPAKRNPLSEAMLTNLAAQFVDVPSSIGIIVIRAAGPVFSAGHNLRELSSEVPSEKHHQVLGTCARMMLSLRACAVPVLASVHGMAAAAGCQMVAHCDLAIAGESARFALPGIHVGLFCTTPGVAVGRAMSSRKKIAEMLFTGDPISAKEALQYGLIGSVVPDAELESATDELAAKIVRHSRPVVRVGKKAFLEQMALGNDLEGAYLTASKSMGENLRLVDTQRGINAFLKKEKPQWTHEEKKVD